MKFRTSKCRTALFFICFSLLFLMGHSFAQDPFNLPIAEGPEKQLEPRVIFNVSGDNFAVFWIDESSNPSSIAAQLIARDGIPQFAAPLEIVRGQNPVVAFDVASDGQGNYFLIWEEAHTQGSYLQIMRISSNDGIAWRKPLKPTILNRWFSNPMAVVDGEGGVYVAWEESESVATDVDEAAFDIYAQHLSRGGDVYWEAGGIPVGKAPQTQRLGDIIALPEGLAIAWEDWNRRANNVLFQVFNFKSGKPATNNPGEPAKALTVRRTARPRMEWRHSTSESSVFLVWEEYTISGDRDLYGQLFSARADRIWGRNGKPIATGDGDQFNHEIIDTGDGELLVVWQTSKQGQIDLRAQRFSKSGNRVWGNAGEAVIEAPGDQVSPRLASDFNEGFYCIWEDTRAGEPDLYAQHLSRSGKQRWPDAGVAVSVAGNAQNHVSIVSHEGTGFFAAWVDGRAGNPDIFAQIVSRGGELLNVKPQIISQSPESAVAGQRFEYTVEVLDYDRDFPMTFVLLEAPEWLEIQQTGGIISGIPPFEGGSVVAVTVQVTDSRGASSTQSFSLQIIDENHPPVITSEPPTTILEDSLYTYQITFDDPDRQDTHRLVLSVMPSWLGLLEDGFTLQGVPGNDDVGMHQVSFAILDHAGASDRQDFSIEVVNTNDPPQFIQPVQIDTAFEDRGYTLPLVASDPDPDDRLAFLLLAGPDWLSLSAEDATLTGTPANEDVGVDTVAAAAVDAAGAADTLRFTLVIQNVNDPPFFTTLPDTVAVVDSIYLYEVGVEDIDPGDSTTVTLEQAPGWLVLDATENVLQGVAPAADAGKSLPVSIRVSDVAGAVDMQEYMLQVIDKTEPDTIAPGRPAEFELRPAVWSNVDSVLLVWLTPEDPGGIAEIFIKYDAPPEDANDFDVRRALESRSGQLDSLSIAAPPEGAHWLFFWFADKAGNVDIASAASVYYRIDRSAPVAPVAIQPQRWSRGDTVTFVWQAAVDSVSGISEYVLEVDGAVAGRKLHAQHIEADTLRVSLPLNLGEKLFSWRVLAVDSAGNISASEATAFLTDNLPPLIVSPRPDTADAGRDVPVQANISDQRSGVHSAELWYRASGAVHVQKIAMAKNDGENYTATIPGRDVAPEGMEYTIAAIDSAGNRRIMQNTRGFGLFHSILVKSRGNRMPGSTQAQRYRMISVPFHVPGRRAADFFEKNFGAYDNTEWRLLQYQNGAYVEFGDSVLAELQPAQSWWLITRTSQDLQTDEVVSVTTDSAYHVVLQPGWNMIATPFAFPTDWQAAVIPAGVEKVLWGFNGINYVSESSVLQPWEGYFVKNNNTAPALLEIAPQPLVSLAKWPPFWQEMEWVCRLSVTQNGRADIENYFGASQIADAAGEANNLSDPPPIGSVPRLYFERKDASGETAALAADFRSAANGQWRWELVVENLDMGAIELQLQDVTPWPDSLAVVITDQKTGVRRRMYPGTSLPLLIAEYENSRRLTLLVGGESGIGAEVPALPDKLTLHRFWPNPVRIGQNGDVVIRFALAEPATAEVFVFNVLGQLVWKSVGLSSRLWQAGENAVVWHGRDLKQRPVASGVYVVAVQVGAEMLRQKIMLLR